MTILGTLDQKGHRLHARAQVIRAGLHSTLGRYPTLFMPYMRLRGRNLNRLADEQTELVIEGYPRSGNTFAVVAFRLAQDRDVRIAHHLHASAQVIWASRRNVPALVLIRKPEDAVLSLMIRDPSTSISQELRRYTRFYEALSPYRDRYILAAFEEVIDDFGQVVDRVNSRFSTSFQRFEHTEKNVNHCFEIIEEINIKHSGRDTITEHTIARPSPVREEAKEQLAEQLRDAAVQPLAAQANELYDRLLLRR